MLSELKLRATIGVFFVLGWVIRKIYPDPLADFFSEMEKTGRLKIIDEPDQNVATADLNAGRVSSSSKP
jgi:hypothetical protein